MARNASGTSHDAGDPEVSTKISTSRPRVGSARPKLASVTTANPPRRRCPMASPAGSAMITAMPRAMPVYARC